ncbi:MAG: hypothetical protein D6761_03335 [Candidatus Dadabacteria bacterium]|nr:MAG: hypothetical protein D6761_03335 [Candidatus Dadabacteria bacterium]
MATHVRFPLTEPTSAELFAAIEKILQGDQTPETVQHLAHALEGLTSEAMDFFLFGIAERISLGGFMMKTVQLGAKTAEKGFGMVIRGLIHRLSPEQMHEVATFLKEVTSP